MDRDIKNVPIVLDYDHTVERSSSGGYAYVRFIPRDHQPNGSSGTSHLPTFCTESLYGIVIPNTGLVVHCETN